jgi:hypothetical protein
MGGATVIDSISTVARLLKRLAVQYGTDAVMEVVEVDAGCA